jgi:hypothetical protein
MITDSQKNDIQKYAPHFVLTMYSKKLNSHQQKQQHNIQTKKQEKKSKRKKLCGF